MEFRRSPIEDRELGRLQTQRTAEAKLAQERLKLEGGEAFTLAPGQSRFDASGKLIASVVKPDEDPLDKLLSPNESVTS